ncbi:hypothetical protein [Stenotrophomonas sp. B1-1]|uniref:hypothetical protein n=1 Tax=Stenotrophomonas sp. B1-1 TaxID=2710648 RepID=UPI0013DC8AE2|nr:hypothetical protein [Stenotrophomonas sp. B1-1]
MDIEGKYTLPNGEVLEVHVNIAVNTWRNGEWTGFHQVSEPDFRLCMGKMKKQGAVHFEPRPEVPNGCD